MTLKHAVLAVLLDGEASGYDLSKRFDVSVANFWHALPQQLYQELARMEDTGLVVGTVVQQERRPDKRVFAITNEGRAVLEQWLATPSRAPSIKSDLLVRVYAADVADADVLCAELDRQIAQNRAKLDFYQALRRVFLSGRSEEAYLQSTDRIGPYMTLKRGIMYEEENIAWSEWAISTLRARSGAAGAAGADRLRPGPER